jgi:hypothetical protein
MTSLNRMACALLLAGSVASCSDATGVGPADLSLQLAVAGPSAVSPAELAALGDAFDLVDRYVVEMVDAETLEVISEADLDIQSGGEVHTLELTVPQGAIGGTVTITLIAYAGDVELYRSVSTTTLGQDVGPLQVQLEVRYTGPSVRGTITDDSGDPVAGVNVDLFQNQSIVQGVSTEPDGTYLFTGLSSGSYQIEPLAPSGTFICPVFRDVSWTSGDVVVADFGTSTSSCDTSVLVVSGGDLDETGVVASMLANDPNLTVSTFFHVSGLPGAELLAQHDVVLLFMNGLFNESAALGTEIADYVAAGGNVVMASFYWQGRSDSGQDTPGWGTLEDIDPFTSSGGDTEQPVALNANSVIAHPLTAGLTTLTSREFSSGVLAKSVASVVALWDDGAPLMGYSVLPGGQRIVGVSLFPAATASVTGDSQILWENAVNWAGAAGGPAPVGGR